MQKSGKKLLHTHGLAALRSNNHTHCSGLPFNGVHPRNPFNYYNTTHLLTLKRWKADLAWLADHSGHFK